MNFTVSLIYVNALYININAPYAHSLQKNKVTTGEKMPLR
jgi:hypothetical protein